MTVEWLYSVMAKVARVAPTQTVAITILSLVSQLTLLLAFLLPIKVLILLGSDGVPQYFPAFLTAIDREQLIMALAGTSICSYLVHSLCEKFNVRLGIAGSGRILARASKFELFDNQTGRARRAYVQYAQGLAALAFLVIGFFACLYYYPLVGVVTAIGCTMAFVFLMVRYAWDAEFQREIFTLIPVYIKTIADLLFLAVFVAIVADFLWGQPPSLLIGIVSLILARQWVSRVTMLVTNAVSLAGRKVEVSALFFHAQISNLSSQSDKPQLWRVVEDLRNHQNFAAVLASVNADHLEVTSSSWIQTGQPGVATFMLALQDKETKAIEAMLVKLFAKQKQTYANNELSILTTEDLGSLPTYELVGATSIGGLPCHIFKVDMLQAIPAPDRFTSIVRFRLLLSAAEPRVEFLDKYYRSHPPLWLRICKPMIDQLRLVANDSEELELIENFECQLPAIQNFLQQLPATIVNSEALRNNIYQDSNNLPVSISWGRWSVDPIGSSWPAGFENIECFEHLYAELVGRRPSLKKVPIGHVRFAAKIWEMDAAFSKQLFSDCIGSLAEITESYNLSLDRSEIA